jgi:hypothetical protein
VGDPVDGDRIDAVACIILFGWIEIDFPDSIFLAQLSHA